LEMGVSRTICLGWPRTTILWISASQEARIRGVNHHWHPVSSVFSASYPARVFLKACFSHSENFSLTLLPFALCSLS
jgi:hypothetical protein